MKKTIITTFLITGALAVTLNTANIAPCDTDLGFKNISAITLGYDKSMSENGMLMNLLLGMGLLGWKTTVQSQFKDSSLLLKGFLGSKQVIDISLTEDIYNYYKTAQTKITSKNIKNGEIINAIIEPTETYFVV